MSKDIARLPNLDFRELHSSWQQTGIIPKTLFSFSGPEIWNG